jgi:hypothetical protein
MTRLLSSRRPCHLTWSTVVVASSHTRRLQEREEQSLQRLATCKLLPVIPYRLCAPTMTFHAQSPATNHSRSPCTLLIFDCAYRGEPSSNLGARTPVLDFLLPLSAACAYWCVRAGYSDTLTQKFITGGDKNNTNTASRHSYDYSSHMRQFYCTLLLYDRHVRPAFVNYSKPLAKPKLH